MRIYNIYNRKSRSHLASLGCFLWVIIPALVSFGGCSGYSVTGGPGPLLGAGLSTESNPNFEPLRINEIAILPFDSKTNVLLDESSAEILSNGLVEAFSSKTTLSIVNKSKAGQVINALSSLDTKMNQMAERAASLGKALSVQGVLYGSVTHYAGIHARDADVGFKLWLLEPSSGRTLWSATYAKTNKPLSENLFRLKEMLDKGLELEGRVELVNGGFKEAATKLEALRIGDAKEMSQGF